MELSRNLTLKLNFFLDNYIPPVIRDSKLFMTIPFKVMFGDKARIFFEFKNKATKMTETEFIGAYADAKSAILKRETDLNEECIKKILINLTGHSVLDVGCGKCFLAKKISRKYRVTAVDIDISDELIAKCPSISFKNANVERLPFKSKEFDTVICAHTLEHVQNIYLALGELRRVAKKRLIIVVPKQRPYKYTFDLHLHFFPYPHSLLSVMGTKTGEGSCEEVGGDLFYVENRTS